MTGQIIPFQTFRYRDEAPARQGPAIDDLARPIGSQSDFGPPVPNTRILKLQVARIAQLLDELEGLARNSDNFPPAIVEIGRAHV